MWNFINPRYYFRTVGWYLNFYDRMRIEKYSRPSATEQSASYRRSMRDAGRGHLLP